MADITGTLTQEIGPLPVWAWGVAIAGGLGVGWYIQSRRTADMAAAGAESDQQASEQAGAEAARDGLPTTQGALALPGGGSQGAGMAPVLPEEQTGGGTTSTNSDWRSAGVQHLTGAGVSSTEADAALGRYLAGQRITQAQSELVDRAIGELGTPPEPVPPPEVGPPPQESEPPSQGEPEPSPEPPSEPDPAPPQPAPEPPQSPEPSPDPAPAPEPEPDPAPAPTPDPGPPEATTLDRDHPDWNPHAIVDMTSEPLGSGHPLSDYEGPAQGVYQEVLNIATGEWVPAIEVPPEPRWSMPGQYGDI